MKNYKHLDLNLELGTKIRIKYDTSGKIFGFSIIEILVAIFIFSLGLVSVYAVISSTLRLNDYNKNFIIASNLAREQVELLKNIRDVNFKTIHKYNQININKLYTDTENFFSSGTYYKIENDYSASASFPIIVKKINDFGEGKGEIASSGFGKMQNFRVCLDSENKYVNVDDFGACPSSTKETKFFKYLQIEDVIYNPSGEIIPNALRVKSKVIWYIRGYHETEINTIISDWQRL